MISNLFCLFDTNTRADGANNRFQQQTTRRITQNKIRPTEEDSLLCYWYQER